MDPEALYSFGALGIPWLPCLHVESNFESEKDSSLMCKYLQQVAQLAFLGCWWHWWQPKSESCDSKSEALLTQVVEAGPAVGPRLAFIETTGSQSFEVPPCQQRRIHSKKSQAFQLRQFDSHSGASNSSLSYLPVAVSWCQLYMWINSSPVQVPSNKAAIGRELLPGFLNKYTIFVSNNYAHIDVFTVHNIHIQSRSPVCQFISSLSCTISCYRVSYIAGSSQTYSTA